MFLDGQQELEGRNENDKLVVLDGPSLRECTQIHAALVLHSSSKMMLQMYNIIAVLILL